MKRFGLALLCAVGAMAMGATAGPVLAQGSTDQPRLDGQVTVAELAGTWVEPVTESDEDGMKIVGSENIVEIKPDGSFTDGLSLSFEFDYAPEFNGTYMISTAGRISIAGDNITWTTQSAEVVPVFPANVSETRRDDMESFASQMAEGMISAETYPIISYDGREMVMNAGADSVFEEYSMVRR